MMERFEHTQSINDIPCRVKACPEKRKSPPDILLSKWSDEAYLAIKTSGKNEMVRTAEKQSDRLVIETNKRKHRITRLDSDRIEYDIIIYEAPKFGELKLPVEFPKGLAFYQQGMKAGNGLAPEIKGSWAVYWKNKNNQYRTGKLCHIYRPRIIDSKGNHVWGEIDYDGTGLVMRIPETFLKRCSFPVLVDPIMGTSSVGSQHLMEDGGDYYDYYYEMIMPANPYTVVDPVNGSCTAYIYSYHSDSEARGYPCLYSNSGSNPSARLSSSEVYADLRNPNASGEWLSADFNVSGNISAGSTVWLAYMTHYYFFPYFDNGGTASEMNVEDESSPPNTFVNGGWTPNPITISMYFSYVSAQNYTRSILNSAGITDSVIRLNQSIRAFDETSTGTSDSLNRSKGMNRAVTESSTQSDSIFLRASFGRALSAAAGIAGNISRIIGIRLQLITASNPSSAFKSLLTRIRTLTDKAVAASLSNKLYNSRRKIEEGQDTAEGVSRTQNVKRPHSETPDLKDNIIRQVLKRIFINGLTEIWDYIKSKKVKSKEEITIMSRVTTEYEIQSRIS